MTGRRSVWSDPRVIELAGNFVPAADDHVCLTIVEAPATAASLPPEPGFAYYLVSAVNADASQ